MLYLITGANGAGKTLNALKWIRERSLKESRPVCHNGRFEAVENGELSSWKKIDIKEWQSEPDGTIFLVDECHNDFPLRAPSSQPPEYIRMLAEHRRRGFDFYLITQHPQNIDSFIRRLIGSPGWHRHLKRTFGGDLVSVCEWPSVNPNCEKDGSGKTGTVTMQAFPKDVFSWYRSASLHTGKRKLPMRLWVALACLLLVPLLIYFAFSGVQDRVTKRLPSDLQNPSVVAPGAPSTSLVSAKPVQTLEDYLQQRSPLIPDFPHTAPVYAEVTKPVHAPFPAACVTNGTTCKCYTQQATVMHMSGETCLQIVKHGFFMDWQDQTQESKKRSPLLVDGKHEKQDVKTRVRSVPMPEPQPNLPGQITQADIPHVLAMRRPSMQAYAAH